jgi:cobalt/nickel transport system permease protein
MHPDIDKYAHLSSPIHRWDPRVKILGLFVLIFTIALLKKFPLVLASFVIALSLVLISRIPFAFIVKRLLPVTVFLFPFFIIMPLTVPGEQAIHILTFSFSLTGLRIASLIYIKAISIVSLIIAMMGTAPFTDSMKALEKLKVPQVLIQMILFTYRYIFVFLMEIRRMNNAMKARNFERKTNLHTLKTTGNFVGVLLVRSFERTERIYQAMLSRGYDGVLRTFFEYRIVALDYVKGSLVVLISIMLFVGDKLI